MKKEDLADQISSLANRIDDTLSDIEGDVDKLKKLHKELELLSVKLEDELIDDDE